MRSALGREHIINVAVLLRRSNCDHALMAVVSSHAIEFRPRHESHRHCLSSALVYDSLQAQVMALFRHAYPFERTAARLQRLGDGINAVDKIHRSTSLMPWAWHESADTRMLD